MKLFIAGICGTFMGGIAQIAKQAGHTVAGCDENIYPPMSTLLEQQSINIQSGFAANLIDYDTERVIIGNALSRGNPIVEYCLNENRHYQSGPQWLSENILINKQVFAVAGTHGKTTTTAMLTWILEVTGQNPGFLIGGKPGNFDHSARLTDSDYFVIEADEYDTAFFDKRAKFVHYRPKVAVLNNLEFDHADIYPDLEHIKIQFHHLIRLVPQNGHIIVSKDDENLQEVLHRGAWSTIHETSVTDASSEWYCQADRLDYSQFTVYYKQQAVARVGWSMIGVFNMSNALQAIAAAHSQGVAITEAAQALNQFKPPARRLQHLLHTDTTELYEDFAHHPTSIALTLEALKQRHHGRYLTAVIEFRSNTMRLGHHQQALKQALSSADEIIVYMPNELAWDINQIAENSALKIFSERDTLLDAINKSESNERVIVCLSNGGFDNIPQQLKQQLEY